MLRRQAFHLGVAGAVALALAASAYAYVCHPDLPGTRSLAVQGKVDSYSPSRLRARPPGDTLPRRQGKGGQLLPGRLAGDAPRLGRRLRAAYRLAPRPRHV